MLKVYSGYVCVCVVQVPGNVDILFSVVMVQRLAQFGQGTVGDEEGAGFWVVSQMKGDSSEKMTLPQPSAVQSILQNISLSLMFFLERSGFFAALLDTRPSPKVFASLCVQMHSHLPAAIPEQALYWGCPDFAAESTLRDGPGACWTFLGALKPSSQQLNRSL